MPAFVPRESLRGAPQGVTNVETARNEIQGTLDALTTSDETVDRHACDCELGPDRCVGVVVHHKHRSGSAHRFALTVPAERGRDSTGAGT